MKEEKKRKEEKKAFFPPPVFASYKKEVKEDGDHLQTCKAQSGAQDTHDWVVYRLGLMIRSVGHCGKVFFITLTVI